MTILEIPETVKTPTSDKPQYNQQYCDKHDQRYGDHLHRCPICAGEELALDQNIIADVCKHNPDQIQTVVEKIVKKWGDDWGEFFTKHANACTTSLRYEGK